MAEANGITRRGFLKGSTIGAAGLGLVAAQQAGLGELIDLDALATAPTAAAPAPAPAGPLVLFDGNGPVPWVGVAQSKLMMNLLGRFVPSNASSSNVTRKKIGQYVSGDIERYPITFYVGHNYDNPLPDAFKNDVVATNKPVVWLNYNIWQMTWGDSGPAFTAKYGWTFNGLSQPATTQYLKIRYKGIDFVKSALDQEIGVTWIIDPAKATAIATAVDQNGNEVPYITRSGNFWYVADMPFSYMSEEGRYLVFADALFDMLGVTYAQTRRALVRIEDVSGFSNATDLRRVADYLSAGKVPFSVALIAVHKDPRGVYSNGVPQSIPVSRASRQVRDALAYMKSRGGEFFLHGTTHQYSNVLNPYTAVSADDYELYRVTENADHSLTYVGPVPGDSDSWVRKVLADGVAELKRANLAPVGFEAPHYAASAVDYARIARDFNVVYHRSIYFDDPTNVTTGMDGGMRLRKRARNRRLRRLNGGVDAMADTAQPTDRMAGQFAPYVIVRDFYGQRIIPENLGNLEPTAWPDPVVGPYPRRLPEDIVRAASKNLGIRDGWASLYFHPFLETKLLSDSVDGVKGLGFDFVKASSLVTAL